MGPWRPPARRTALLAARAEDPDVMAGAASKKNGHLGLKTTSAWRGSFMNGAGRGDCASA
jgi:hypothetical protein